VRINRFSSKATRRGSALRTLWRNPPPDDRIPAA
jgi:hypothetical protein